MNEEAIQAHWDGCLKCGRKPKVIEKGYSEQFGMCYGGEPFHNGLCPECWEKSNVS